MSSDNPRPTLTKADPGHQPGDVAAEIKRGVRRTLADHGLTSLTEFTLKGGRRADIIAIDPKGKFTIVEVKSSVADFRADSKWPEYRDYCDLFYFAVRADFPQELIPETCGLLVADAYEASIVRGAPAQPLAPARRRSVLLRFAMAAAGRLHRVEDPGLS
jgi:hypothetical protein